MTLLEQLRLLGLAIVAALLLAMPVFAQDYHARPAPSGRTGRD